MSAPLLSEILDVDRLRAHIDAGDVKVRRHKSEPLDIYNYSAKCQFERIWTPETMACRGLIVHTDTGEVIARPFSKFFNLEEHTGDVPWHEPHAITEKLDGSLGIAYLRPSDRRVCIATRGAFHSPQAEWATDWLWRTHPEWFPAEGETSLFEILYPGSRVVVDYGANDGMVLLTSIDAERNENAIANNWPGSLVKTFAGGRDGMLAAVATARGVETEGFVVRFSSGLRVKVKAPDYVRLHRLVCALSTRRVWEVLSSGQNFGEFLECVPDEFASWVKSARAGLERAVADIDSACRQTVEDARLAHGEDRRKLAEFIKARQPVHSGVCFMMLDGKADRARQAAWKAVYPAHETFRSVDEATS